MKALSLWQPWASAVALGHKVYETRSWSTDYRGPLAIHAAQASARAAWAIGVSALVARDFPAGFFFPRGGIVAVVQLVDVLEMTPELIAATAEKERRWGDWQPGRFAWKLEQPRALKWPVGLKGRQRLFNVSEAEVRMVRSALVG